MAKPEAKPGSSRQPEILQDPQKAAVLLLALEPEAAVQVLAYLREPERAEEVLSRVNSVPEERPFAFLYHADPAHIASVLQQEQPQTVALVLAHLPPHQAAAVLSHLPGELQAEFAVRIAQMERIPQQLVREIEAVLRRKMSAIMGEDGMPAGGLEVVVELLHHVDRTTERRILEKIESTDPQLAEAIRQRMFVFEDLVHLDDRSLQRVLREVDMNDLPRALKIASPELETDYRAKAEQAQQNIVRVVRRLEERGKSSPHVGGKTG